jgi:5-methylcytosine-specific restriction endonuclease McrA
LSTHVQHLRRYESNRWQTDREHMAKRNLQWRRSHPMERAQNEAKRRAKITGVEIDPVDYPAILERDGWICYLCGGQVTPETLSFDHVIPISKGGPHTACNIKVSHRSCNSKKGSKIL